MAGKIQDELHISRPLDSLARELTLNLYRSTLYLTDLLEGVLRPSGLRLDEYNVLRIVRGAGEAGHERADIEERMVHEADRLLAIVHRLRSRGLVEGTLRLVITPAGRELLGTLDAPFDRAIEELVGWIPAEELRTAIGVLERIRGGPPAGGERTPAG